MFQDHQTISALSCFFDAAKVLRKTRQNNPFPTTSPKKSCFWEKSGISWEKVRRKRKRKLKSKENEKITPFSPQKSLIFSQRWEKSWESWEKSRESWGKSWEVEEKYRKFWKNSTRTVEITQYAL